MLAWTRLTGANRDPPPRPAPSPHSLRRRAEVAEVEVRSCNAWSWRLDPVPPQDELYFMGYRGVHAMTVSRKRDLDLTSERFGRLTVLDRGGRSRSGHQIWLASCDCGAQTMVQQKSLRSGQTRSCGCLARETVSRVTRARMTTHGGTGSPEYDAWLNMRARCKNSSNKHWGHYGGRGITVCERWAHDFSAFLSDMGPRPIGMTLDRIDVNGNYEPGNCRWVSRKEQNRNTRANRIITWRGESRPLAEWAEHLGINVNTIRGRLDRGWPLDRVMSEVVRKEGGSR